MYLTHEKLVTIGKIEKKFNLVNGKAVEFSFVFEDNKYVNDNFYNRLSSNYYYLVFIKSDPKFSWILFDYPSTEKEFRKSNVYSIDSLPKNLNDAGFKIPNNLDI